MSILTVNKVSYHYAKTTNMVLTDIDIAFELGKIYSIVGKSGSGKTTFLSLIAGLDLPSKGSVCYHDTNLKEMNRDIYRSRHAGVVFQQYNLLINATALDNVLLSMEISGVKQKDKKEYAYSVLEKVGIGREKANRKVLKLSGGEQQRVGIARAIAHQPDIIIADEPSGNLDTETEESMMQLLVDLAHEENKCVIIVTHSKKVSSYADEIWGMNKGQLLFVK